MKRYSAAETTYAAAVEVVCPSIRRMKGTTRPESQRKEVRMIHY